MLEQRVLDVFRRSLPEHLGPTFEPRPGQVEMASLVERALSSRSVLVVEAETGLGKSLAYLIPLLLHCQEEKKRAVVCTYTINLQRQLEANDLPLAAKAASASVPSATLLGRANYLCRRAAARLLEGGVDDRVREALTRALEEGVGDVERIPEVARRGELIDSLSCPARESVCRGCRQKSDCFLLQARERALSRPLVLANHALLLSDRKAQGALLGDRDLLVIDEAHHLPEATRSFLTISFSPRSIAGSKESLYGKEHEELFLRARALGGVGKKGERLAHLQERMARSHIRAQRAADGLFALIAANLDRWCRGRVVEESGERIGHARGSQFFGKPASNASSIAYREGSPLLYGTDQEQASLLASLIDMASTAAETREVLEGWEKGEELVMGLGTLVEEVSTMKEDVEFLLRADDEDYAFFLRQGRGRLELAASPVEVGPQLGALLTEAAQAVVLTSATLSVGGDFGYALENFGLQDLPRILTGQFATPFDLPRQRKVLIATDLPDPSKMKREFIAAAASLLAELSRRTARRMLVLCTSREQVSLLQGELSCRRDLADLVLAQSPGTSREELTCMFREGEKKILLGLASFWEGVDFPGTFLEVLVVMKMPFLAPTDPLVDARAKRISERGGNPFTELFLPDAILKLKQGFGRLIRTGSDKGVVIVLDSRLGSRNYGEEVLGAVAEEYELCPSSEELLLRSLEVLEEEEGGNRWRR